MAVESEHEMTLTEQSTASAGGLSTTLDSSASARLDVTREELERRQLVHNGQLLKLELAQKNLLLDSLRHEQASVTEELQEKLSDALHERKLLQLRLSAITQAYEDELRVLRERMQATVPRPEGGGEPVVGVGEKEVKEALHLPLLSEAEYLSLRSQDSSRLSLQDYIRLRNYECVESVHREAASTRQRLTAAEEQQTLTRKEMSTCQKQGSVLAEELQLSQKQCAEVARELTSTRAQVHDHNYKVEHYDVIKREKDDLQRELEAQRLSVAELQASKRCCLTESDQAKGELASCQHSMALLAQDKEYLVRQVSQLSRRAAVAEDRSEALLSQLDQCKAAKEALYSQLIKAGEEHKAVFEQRLQRELEALRLHTAAELERLNTQSREAHEQEIRSLRESRESLAADVLRARAAEKEATSRQEQLSKELQQLHSSYEGRLAELQHELRVKCYECERSGAACEEARREVGVTGVELARLREREAVLRKELGAGLEEGGARTRALEERLAEQTRRLQAYDQLEQELDDVIMQAAEGESEGDAERVLFSYGFGATVPSTARRRMQQSVQLARRVLRLERLNVSLRKEAEAASTDNRLLQDKLASTNDLVEKAQQPYGYLVQTLRHRDEALKAAQKSVAHLKAELQQAQEAKSKLVHSKNKMAADLEQLLSHREELGLMREVVEGLLPCSQARPEAGAGSEAGHHHSPPPTLFTKRTPSSWHGGKLRQQHPQHHSPRQPGLPR